MDPNAAWETIIDGIRDFACDNHTPEEASEEKMELAYLMEELAGWMKKGGFMNWQRMLDYAK